MKQAADKTKQAAEKTKQAADKKKPVKGIVKKNKKKTACASRALSAAFPDARPLTARPRRTP